MEEASESASKAVVAHTGYNPHNRCEGNDGNRIVETAEPFVVFAAVHRFVVFGG